jgi:Mg-chelatase subunit ChlD
VTQAGGASPLWDAICLSVEALRNSSGLRAIVVFSDGQASANDHGADDALDVVTRAAIVVSVVGVADRALTVKSEMEVFGRNGALRRLADDTGGGFAELKTRHEDEQGGTIANALNRLRGRVRLEFVPPVREGALHRVSVTARGRSVYGPARLRF